ncbi:hypothetical protein J2I47_00920 [Fibrella sp. HMF5335]|uniref:HTH cro/C1-type domain-containing protein n=1 Tax=Fibrella rubiginis TaxID=2817060 RepID=A0A939K3G0_9BACT|nr:hypothetical protein [Fibrella rubiginis]MBO0935096.1 hypothetical protein [Fibrella rubiginis]
MLDNTDLFHDEDRLFLGNIFGKSEGPIRQHFEKRLAELGINQTTALSILDIESRTLTGILDGTQKRLDFLALLKFAHFLNLSPEHVVSLLFKKLQTGFKDELEEYKVREFIVNNFDLNTLHKIGFLDSTTDFKHINERLISYFGYKSIFEYESEKFDSALSSSTKRKPKDKLTKNFWLKSARKNASKINNYFEYDRGKLFEYIPKLRWHSMNEEKGLYQAIRDLFKLGVTVIFEPYIDGMYVRGATFAVNDKPAIALTNYTNYYPSLWFALMHEIHHVLYDWELIQLESYHVSGALDLFSKEEVDADDFARSCLVPIEMMKDVVPYIGNSTFVREFAKANYIHPSIIYIFYCWDNQDKDKKVWGRFNEFIPNVSKAISALNGNPWQKRRSIKEITQQRQEEVFNGL